MKTIAQLQSVLSAFPCPFAAQSNHEAGDISDFPLGDEEDGAKTNFETGIPSKYSPDQTSPSLLPRGDFNRIGEIATRELFFRSAGGIHSFDKGFSAANNGYANGIALAYDDKKMIRIVESQEAENDLNFSERTAVIDALANKPSDVTGTVPRVLWKSVSRVYGIEKEMLHVGVDYSRKQIVSSGDTLAHDSFAVIGASFYGVGTTYGSLYRADAGTYKITVTIGDKVFVWDNKGMQGMILTGVGLLPFIGPLLDPIYPGIIYGGANAPMAFFVRKGMKVSYSATANGTDNQSGIYAYAYPIEAEVYGEEASE